MKRNRITSALLAFFSGVFAHRDVCAARICAKSEQGGHHAVRSDEVV